MRTNTGFERTIPDMLGRVLNSVFAYDPDVQRVGALHVWAIDNWLFLARDPGDAGEPARWTVWFDLPDDHPAWGTGTMARLQCFVGANRRRSEHETFWSAVICAVNHMAHYRAHLGLERVAREFGYATGRKHAARPANAN